MKNEQTIWQKQKTFSFTIWSYAVRDAVFYQQKETNRDASIGFRKARFTLIEEQDLLLIKSKLFPKTPS